MVATENKAWLREHDANHQALLAMRRRQEWLVFSAELQAQFWLNNWRHLFPDYVIQAPTMPPEILTPAVVNRMLREKEALRKLLEPIPKPEPTPPTPIPADITFDAVGTKVVASILSGHLFPIAIGDLIDGYIVFAISCWDMRSISAVAFDGMPMTPLGHARSSAELRANAWLFGLAVGNKAAGTYNAMITLSAAGLDYVIANLASYQGVDQTASAGLAATAFSNINIATVDVASAAGELVVGYGYCDGGGGAASAGEGQTARWDHAGAGGASMFSDEPGAAIITHSYTFAIAGTIILAVPLKPAMRL
jgi:hypothetical protein